MKEINQQQASALAFILNQIRPEWTTKSIMTVIEKNKMMPSYADLVLAAVAKAREPSCATPAPIFMQGPHWPAPVRSKLPPAPKCEDHTTYDAHSCSCCWADIKLGERPENMLGKRLIPKNKPTTKPINWGQAFETIGNEETPPTFAEATRGVAPF